MYHHLPIASRVALLTFAILVGPPGMLASDAGVTPNQAQPFQWYVELDEVDYASGFRQLEMEIPANRLAVIEWISFRAGNVQCALKGVFLQTTLRGQNALHTIVGVTDMGSLGVGRVFGLSENIRAFAGPGTTVTLTILPEFVPGEPCTGDGLDLTVTGHYERP